MKKIVSLICCAVLILTLAVPAAAAYETQKSKMTTFVVTEENITISVPKDNVTVESTTGGDDPAFRKMGEDGGEFLKAMRNRDMRLFSTNEKQDTFIVLTVSPAPDTAAYQDLTAEQQSEESDRIAEGLKESGYDVPYNGIFTGSGFYYNVFCYGQGDYYYWEYLSILNEKCYSLCMTKIGSPFTTDEGDLMEVMAETMAFRHEPIIFFDDDYTMMAEAPRGAHLVPELAARNEADEIIQMETGNYLVLATEKDPKFPKSGNSVTLEQASKLLDVPAENLEELQINGQKYFAAKHNIPMLEGVEGEFINHMYMTFRDGCGYMLFFAIPKTQDSRSEDMIKNVLDSVYFFK